MTLQRLRICRIVSWVLAPGVLALAVLGSSGCASPLSDPGTQAVEARRADLAAARIGAGVSPGPIVELTSADGPIPAPVESLLDAPRLPDFLLLGEVHDNPVQHQLRANWLARLAQRHRFVLALEQLDADRQSDLDDARRKGLRDRALAQAAGFESRGWNWDFYGPYLRIALEHGLPVVAANLSNREAREIARSRRQLPAGSRPAGWNEQADAALRREIDRGHCGMLPPSALGAMARAQMARDATIASTIAGAAKASGLPVILLAGNGHVRRDFGVPRHLRASRPDARLVSVGLLEQVGPGSDAGEPVDAGATFEAGPAYDLVVLTPPHPRPDPCEAFRQHMERKRGGG